MGCLSYLGYLRWKIARPKTAVLGTQYLTTSQPCTERKNVRCQRIQVKKKQASHTPRISSQRMKKRRKLRRTIRLSIRRTPHNHTWQTAMCIGVWPTHSFLSWAALLNQSLCGRSYANSQERSKWRPLPDGRNECWKIGGGARMTFWNIMHQLVIRFLVNWLRARLVWRFYTGERWANHHCSQCIGQYSWGGKAVTASTESVQYRRIFQCGMSLYSNSKYIVSVFLSKHGEVAIIAVCTWI